VSASLAKYFAEHRPQPYWKGGERVIGRYKDMPFIGSVGYENMRNMDEGMMALVHLDLPLKDGDVWRTILRVKPRSLKLRK
jgi:hypothetical protein